MNLRFRIHFHTQWGQRLFISGSLPELGEWDPNHALEMMSLGDGNWILDCPFSEIPTSPITYKYFLKPEYSEEHHWESGRNRSCIWDRREVEEMELIDTWRSDHDDNRALLTSAFTRVLGRRKNARKPKHKTLSGEKTLYRFQVSASMLAEDQVVCLIGEDAALGAWNEKKAVGMSDHNFPVWEVEVELENEFEGAYKYGIYDKKKKQIVAWEGGENRNISPSISSNGQRMRWVRDYFFRYEQLWRGSGIAVPVFSLRSETGLGVGEFQDLAQLTDWAKSMGMQMVQVLPINDTIATHTWTDSYPYSAISVFALHPIYLHLPALYEYYQLPVPDVYEEEASRLNALEAVEYEEVLRVKSEEFKRVYHEVQAGLKKDKSYQKFIQQHQDWLIPYAAFSYLRDQYGTADFGTWPDYATYEEKAISRLANPKADQFPDIDIHCFIQYHLHLQLQAAVEYARSQGVVLKGDIPIGISRQSVDAWVAPHLYNMDGQAGAPPDFFSTTGQNWGFPTYNWEEMAKDNYQWWRDRLTHMSMYFDAYRIDHILGFFRIWEIPYHALDGTMGVFNPALPFHVNELMGWGLYVQRDRYCEPYIRSHMLSVFLGDSEGWARENLLDEYEPGKFRVKASYKTQRDLVAFLETRDDLTPQRHEQLKSGMLGLLREVLFVEVPGSEGQWVHPRIGLQQTYSFKELDSGLQELVNRISDDYFYRRHETFWREQAMKKLPAITEATDMLVCGEDLGMVPASVAGVMKELAILSLEIQRMPKDNSIEFQHPGYIPYLSVCSPGTHDTFPIRCWWELDPDRSQRFFNQVLALGGRAPYFCEPWVSKEIFIQHLHSPAMWTIFPLQDLLAIDGELRKSDPWSERINDPSIIPHYWRYRMHLKLEELLHASDFNQEVKQLIDHSGRGRIY